MKSVNCSTSDGQHHAVIKKRLRHAFHLVCIGGLLSTTSAWAYEAKIKFLGLDNQPQTGLNVTVEGKTASYQNGYYVVSGLNEGDYTLSMSTSGYKPFSQSFSVGSNHPKHTFSNRYAIKTVNGYQISGKVIDGHSNSGLGGVTVSADGKTTTSGAGGRYVLKFSEQIA